ncbi:MAG: 3-isopropylmalate dehydratase small subunit, partial [Leptospiraceae bacterium]|nr:3-isopropylmalate dehydratase small subunit [Leptospiraceae bacterium]
DIFYNNCFKNGMLPITFPGTQIREWMALVQQNPGSQFEIDLEKQILNFNGQEYGFAVDEYRRQNLLHGRDDIALTLQHISAIEEFEAQYFKRFTWLGYSA